MGGNVVEESLTLNRRGSRAELVPPEDLDEDQRPLANVNIDALTEVFKRVPFEDRLWTLPLVCKGWRDASRNPDCWMNLDVREWFQERVERDYLWEFECEPTMENLIMKVVDMSHGQLREVRASHCSDKAIEYIVSRCPSLTVLSIPNSLSAKDETIVKLAVRCPSLRVLDVSDCYSISDQALEAVGRHCTNLTWLGRNMLGSKNVRFEPSEAATFPIIADKEAIVVSKHMGNLRHLEMKRTHLSNRGLAHLARGCGQLESLNLACCTQLSEAAIARVTEKCPNITAFTKPITPRLHVESERLRILFG